MPRYSFGDVVVDADARRVTRAGESMSIPDRHLGVLLELLARRETIVKPWHVSPCTHWRVLGLLLWVRPTS